MDCMDHHFKRSSSQCCLNPDVQFLLLGSSPYGNYVEDSNSLNIDIADFPRIESLLQPLPTSNDEGTLDGIYMEFEEAMLPGGSRESDLRNLCQMTDVGIW